jgi:hypothetical protein
MTHFAANVCICVTPNLAKLFKRRRMMRGVISWSATFAGPCGLDPESETRVAKAAATFTKKLPREKNPEELLSAGKQDLNCLFQLTAIAGQVQRLSADRASRRRRIHLRCRVSPLAPVDRIQYSIALFDQCAAGIVNTHFH